MSECQLLQCGHQIQAEVSHPYRPERRTALCRFHLRYALSVGATVLESRGQLHRRVLARGAQP